MSSRKAHSAAEVEPRAGSTYPDPFRARVQGRLKRALGDLFGLDQFGVNLTELPPGAVSALRHWHSHEDEFVYILEGSPVLVTNAGETQLAPGMCAGFKAGSGDAHHLVNRSSADVVFLEVGDRSAGDTVIYPDDDIVGTITPEGTRAFTRKDGRAY